MAYSASMESVNLHRHLPTQNTARGRELAESMLCGKQLKGPKKSAAVEQLATVPEPWLERLADENMAYVALGQSEDLTDTELFPTYTPQRLATDAQTAKPILSKVEAEIDALISKELSETDDGFSQAMIERSKPERLAEKLRANLEAAGLGFAVKVTRDLLPLSYLEGEFTIEKENSELFRELLIDLNGPGVAEGVSQASDLTDNTGLKPESGVVVVPFKTLQGEMMSPVSRESYKQINGMMMDQHLGGNYWENRLIVVDDDVVGLPSLKTGHHSVLLHETGHAIDHIADGIEGLNHRETVDNMYASDLERAKNGEVRFLTSRAQDNEREYMAEAVEAYLTDNPKELGKGYKAANNHNQLKTTNPELFAYVDNLMKLPGSKFKTD